jgi:predicted O-methyltransferase YrrM
MLGAPEAAGGGADTSADERFSALHPMVAVDTPGSESTLLVLHGDPPTRSAGAPLLRSRVTMSAWAPRPHRSAPCAPATSPSLEEARGWQAELGARDTAAVIPLAREILESGTVRAEDGVAIPLHSHIPAEECEIVQQWIAAFQPRTILEIGMAYGISCLFICEAIAERTGVAYHIIDPFQRSQWQSIGVSNLQRAGFGHLYTLHEESSETCLPRLLSEGMRIDFALIDSWHTFDHAMMEFYFVNKLLSVGGVVVLDDVHLPSIQKLMAHISSYDCYRQIPLPEQVRHGVRARARRLLKIPEVRVAAFQKTEPDNRDWDWYREF